MYMVERLDAGDMISKVEVEIDELDNVGTLHDKLSIAGAALLKDTVPNVLNRSISPIPQNEEAATYAPNIKREQERLDWTKTGEELYNQVRGLNPWPVAYTEWNGAHLKVWEAKKVPLQAQEPGKVIELQKEGPVIGPGNQQGLILTSVQPAGKKKMTGEDFLRGANIEIGQKLGLMNEEK